jgi:hypothetical protein
MSGFGMAASMAVLGAGLVVAGGDCDDDASVLIRNLPLVGMAGFFFSYAIGFNSVLLIFLGELFAPGKHSKIRVVS